MTGADVGNYTLFNATATTLADILVAPIIDPVVPISLPNTVVKTSQDFMLTSDLLLDDGVCATPTTSYQLIYLPKDTYIPKNARPRRPVVWL
jgi:hypothetical protein